MTSLNLLAASYSDSENSSESTELTSVPSNIENSVTSSKPPSTNFFLASEEDTSSGEDNEVNNLRGTHTPQITHLKNPFRTNDDSPAAPSLFTNPYREAEDAEKDTLEKHVKFAPKLEDVREINGRKICWNYRKGRCRFGSKCVFAHDCELLQKNRELSADPSQHTISSTASTESSITFNSTQGTRAKKVEHSNDSFDSTSSKKRKFL